jgi:hypothetical protein
MSVFSIIAITAPPLVVGTTSYLILRYLNDSDADKWRRWVRRGAAVGWLLIGVVLESLGFWRDYFGRAIAGEASLDNPIFSWMQSYSAANHSTWSPTLLVCLLLMVRFDIFIDYQLKRASQGDKTSILRTSVKSKGHCHEAGFWGAVLCCIMIGSIGVLCRTVWPDYNWQTSYFAHALTGLTLIAIYVVRVHGYRVSNFD